ncbi:hypothetical protein CRUP_031436, partial [Coryphaenoides rupestris]
MVVGSPPSMDRLTICSKVTSSTVWNWPSLMVSVLQVSTAEENGILLYNGDNDHIAVELVQGHVK